MDTNVKTLSVEFLQLVSKQAVASDLPLHQLFMFLLQILFAAISGASLRPQLILTPGQPVLKFVPFRREVLLTVIQFVVHQL